MQMQLLLLLIVGQRRKQRLWLPRALVEQQPGSPVTL